MCVRDNLIAFVACCVVGWTRTRRRGGLFLVLRYNKCSDDFGVIVFQFQFQLAQILNVEDNRLIFVKEVY